MFMVGWSWCFLDILHGPTLQVYTGPLQVNPGGCRGTGSVGDGKTANDLAIVKAGVWMHVAMSIQHRVVSAYVQVRWILTRIFGEGIFFGSSKLKSLVIIYFGSLLL